MSEHLDESNRICKIRYRHHTVDFYIDMDTVDCTLVYTCLNHNLEEIKK